MIWLYVLFTLLLSFFNAWSVGKGWASSKVMGGGARFMAWMGAIMAAVGFTYCYFIIIAMFGVSSGKLTEAQGEHFLQLGYLIVVFPAIGSGTAITVQSWAHFWKNKTFGNGAVAAWNTYADVHNILSAAEAVPGAWDGVGELFSDAGDSKEGAGLVVICILAALALGAGILTTVLIVRTVNANVLRDMRWEALAARS